MLCCLQDNADSRQLLSPSNIDLDKLYQYAYDAASWSTALPRLNFAVRGRGGSGGTLFNKVCIEGGSGIPTPSLYIVLILYYTPMYVHVYCTVYSHVHTLYTILSIHPCYCVLCHVLICSQGKSLVFPMWLSLTLRQCMLQRVLLASSNVARRSSFWCL